MKPYVKPELFFESYELNQNVAACGWDLKFATKEDCTADFDTIGNNTDYQPDRYPPLFTEQPRCDSTPEMHNDYCYQNGADDRYRLFQS